MENENKSIEPIKPYKKNKDIVIPRTLLKKIVIGLLALICIFFVVIYFTSGLSNKKAKELFGNYWKEQIVNNEDKNNYKLNNVEIRNIDKIKDNAYWVKVDYIQEVRTRIPRTYSYQEFIRDKTNYDNFLKRTGQSEKEYTVDDFIRDTGPDKTPKWKWNWQIEKSLIDLIYTKWDTGWFIEEKKE